ncbi:hypothetical protein LINGRAHAP2_LOCUS14877 [Linum grandiflorum]
MGFVKMPSAVFGSSTNTRGLLPYSSSPRLNASTICDAYAQRDGEASRYSQPRAARDG